MLEFLFSLGFRCVVELFVRFNVIVWYGVEVEIMGIVVEFCFWEFVSWRKGGVVVMWFMLLEVEFEISMYVVVEVVDVIVVVVGVSGWLWVFL